MGMSQSQIELLINARNNAQAAFEQLHGQIGNITQGSTQASKAMDTQAQATQASGVAAQATGVAIGMLVDRLVNGLVSAFHSTIDAANKFDAGMIGLQSVSRAFHQDAGLATDAARKLASDGLMSVGDAATGLKNLLAAGFSLPQATELMMRFKDSAAFGRQGALSMGEAVVSATEGVKNGNSVLVDNAGITKNLSQILVEAGKSQNDLSKASSDSSVRMALFNGIVKEGAPQIGDAAKFLETAAGKQAQFSAQVDIAQQKIGKEMQPALLSLLNTMMPMVQVIGDHADVFLRLAGVLVAVIGPVAALRAATALGIPSLVGMADAGINLMSVFSGGVSTIGDFRAGLQMVGEGAGLTFKNLGLVGTAAGIAGAAFAGWEIGRIIGETTGLDHALQGLFERMQGIDKARINAEITQDTINRATAQGAKATISYSEAVQFIMDKEAIRVAQWNASSTVQKAAIDAEVRLGIVTQQRGDQVKEMLDKQDALDKKRLAAVSVAQAQTKAEGEVRQELEVFGMTMASATGLLAKNEAGFRAWADANKVSKDTVDAVEAALKKHTDAQKKAQDQTKALKEEMEKLDGALSGLGLVTREQAVKELDELNKQMLAAQAGGIPVTATVHGMLPKLQELAVKVKASGIEFAEMERTMRAANAVMASMIPNVDIQVGSMANLLQLVPSVNVEIDQHQLALDKASKAYKDLGITSRDELKKLAERAQQDYQNIAAVVGKTAPEAVAAFKKMVDAQKLASGELPSYWQANVAPVMIRSIDTVKQAVDGSFAQMLLGTKSFHDGFLDIWSSLKKGVENVLSSILQAFTDSFLKGLIGAIQGQQGAFSNAFAGLFGGGGAAGGAGGGAGGGGMLAGLFGGGGAIKGMGGAGGGSIFADGSGTGAMTGGAAGGAGAMQMFGGGLMAVTGGISLFQQASQGNKLGSLMAGAQTGAGIGTMIMPGVGTAIGAGIGAAGGFVASLFGGGKDGRAAVNDFASQLGGFDVLHQKLAALGAEGEAMWIKITQGVGKNDKAGAQAAIQAVVDALAKHNDKLAEAAAAAGQYGMSWEDMDKTVQQSKISEVAEKLLKDQVALEAQGYRHDAVLKKQAESYSALIAKSAALGTELPVAMKPVLQNLADMGLLVDDNGEKIKDLSRVQFVGMGAAAEAAAKQAAEGAKAAEERMILLKKAVGGLSENELAALGDTGRAALNKLLEGIEASHGSVDGMSLAINGAKGDLTQMSGEGQQVFAKILEAAKDAATHGLDYVGEHGIMAGRSLGDSLKTLTDEDFPGMSAAALEALAAIQAATGMNKTEISQFADIGEAKLKVMAESMNRILPAADIVAGGLRDRFNNLTFNPINLDVNVTTHGMPDLSGGGEGADGDVTLRGAAGGGLYSSPTIRVLAESGPEVVGSPNAITRSLAAAMQSQGGGGMFGGSGQAMQDMMAELLRAIKAMPGDMRRNMRDAVLQLG